MRIERFPQRSDVLFGNDAVGIEKQEILPICVFHPVVSGDAPAFVVFVEIFDVDLAFVWLDNGCAWLSRTVFHEDDLKIFVV